MASSRRRIVKSARVRRSAAVLWVLPVALSGSAVTPTSIICPITEEIGPITGTIPAGKDTVVNFSATSWRARYRSTSQSNSTNTNPMPLDELLRTTSTPGEPLRAVSMGNTACTSISSGDIPPASRNIVTRGRFRSGSTSTGKLTAVQVPQTSSKAAEATTKSRFCNENRMIRLSIGKR